jgi:hypothetical protein
MDSVGWRWLGRWGELVTNSMEAGMLKLLGVEIGMSLDLSSLLSGLKEKSGGPDCLLSLGLRGKVVGVYLPKVEVKSCFWLTGSANLTASTEK